MGNVIKYFYALTAINLRATFALRAAFIIKALLMSFNNLVMFITWIIFFNNIPEIQGWTLTHMAAMTAVISAGWGVFVIFFSGLRYMARIIDSGDLDNFLLQPKPVLLSIAGSSSEPSGFGEFISFFILTAAVGILNWSYIPGLIIAVILAALFFASFAIILNSMAFFFSDIFDWVRDALLSIVVMATNPTSIYTGFMKVVIYSVIPIAFVSYLPIEFIVDRDFKALWLAILGVSTLFILSVLFFMFGLKHYESGNRFGIRA